MLSTVMKAERQTHTHIHTHTHTHTLTHILNGAQFPKAGLPTLESKQGADRYSDTQGEAGREPI